MRVDWTKPIEAVHEDGRTFAAVFDYGQNGDHYWIESGKEPEDCALFYYESGEPASPTYKNWRIRNVQPAATKPAISDELVERMVAAVRQHASGSAEVLQRSDGEYRSLYAECMAIAAELPQSVDPDLLEARKCAVPYVDALTSDILEGGYDSSSQVSAALAAIKRGRALERGEP